MFSPTGKRIRIAPVRPNVGIEAAYRKRLDAMIREMQASLLYWLRAAYRQNTPELAQDRSPAAELESTMRRLARRWQKRFDDLAPELARYFATSAMGRADASLRSALKRGGFTVEFKLTASANDALQATIAENVGLIRSIASEHLTDVQGILMRSVTAGRDLGAMTKELDARYGVTRRRAALISRDQNNKATATITRVRQQDLGITKAEWLHSAGGKEPRPSHVAASGKTYDVAKGMLIDGEWIRPGELINCRCVSVSVIEGFE